MDPAVGGIFNAFSFVLALFTVAFHIFVAVGLFGPLLGTTVSSVLLSCGSMLLLFLSGFAFMKWVHNIGRPMELWVRALCQSWLARHLAWLGGHGLVLAIEYGASTSGQERSFLWNWFMPVLSSSCICSISFVVGLYGEMDHVDSFCYRLESMLSHAIGEVLFMSGSSGLGCLMSYELILLVPLAHIYLLMAIRSELIRLEARALWSYLEDRYGRPQ